MKYIIVLCLTGIFIQSTMAQTLTNLPPNSSNSRFGSEDVFENKIVRPALSIRGFDSSTLSGGTSHGLGLKQVLENFFSQEDHFTTVIDEIISEADMDFVTPSGTLKEKRLDLDTNSRITQSRAFVALATYILEKNGYASESQSTFGKTHAVALDSLRRALLNPPGGNHMGLDLVTDESWNQTDNALNIALNLTNDLDPVKLSESLANMARAIDLYLALENAYIHYGDSESPLLSQQERGDLLDHFGINLKAFYKFNVLELGDINGVLQDFTGLWGQLVSPLIDQISSAANLPLKKLQPGNWPYKNLLAVGYASLGMNVSTSGDTPYDDYFNTAYRASFKFDSQDRTKYWSYQTDNGNNFWAEGPFYFHYTLRELIPFWHAVRGNGFYSNGQISYNSLSVQDPFFNPDFTDPLHWLADIVTPDGNIPPLDDGNKSSMNISSLLRWNSNYGDGSLGNKFAAINESEDVSSFGSSRNLLLVELGIPRKTSGGSMPGPADDLTNNSGNDQQLITRRGSSPNTHYVLLNGETGDADNRGEGHEQPDQLQLLYFKGGTSYLMDSGYDEGGILDNSSWNDYLYHNNLAYPQGSLNILPPYNGWEQGSLIDYLFDFKPRKVYNRHNVYGLFTSEEDNITVMNGGVKIYDTILPESSGHTMQFAYYNRKVLFVDDTNPYLIDLNTAEGIEYFYPDIVHQPNNYQDNSLSYSFVKYRLKYFVGANSHAGITQDGQKWTKFGFPNDDDLYVYMNFVEYDNQNIARGSVSVKECGSCENQVAHTVQMSHTGDRHLNTVSFIKATETQPGNIPQPLLQFGNQPYQVWMWQKDSNTIDLLVKKTLDGSGTYGNEINFDIDVNGFFAPALKLPGGTDYGFARFQKNNGVWEIDSDYQINLTRESGVYVYGNSTLSTQTFPSDAKLYIAPSSTLTITGDVTLQSGTTVRLGPDAEIKVGANGKIDADGVTFTTLDGSTAPADRWKHIKLLTDYNLSSKTSTFKNCTFEGADKALYNTSYGTLVETSTFSDNSVGVFANDGLIDLRAIDFEGSGDKAVLARGTGSINLNSKYTTSGFQAPSTISGYTYGIRAYEYGQVQVHHTQFGANGYHGYLSGQGRMFAGKYVDSGVDGYNRFSSAGTKDIYNTAQTSGGSGWTAEARYNWWGSSASPSSSRFSGSVDYGSNLPCDPTLDGEYCNPSSGGGGGGGGICIIGTPGCDDGPVPEAAPTTGAIMLSSAREV